MSWTYEQSSGRLFDPSGSLEGKGYSGQPPHTNIPADEGLACLGPIPRGDWQATSVEYNNPRLGQFVIVLTPDDATRAYVTSLGRDPDSFRMHGERLEPPPGYASDGCIIQVRLIREMFWGSYDKWLKVVPQVTQ